MQEDSQNTVDRLYKSTNCEVTFKRQTKRSTFDDYRSVGSVLIIKLKAGVFVN